MRHLNAAGRHIIGSSESFSLEAYLDDAYVWTIGWGTTRIDGKPVKDGDVITKEKAVECVYKDIDEFEAAINKYVKVSLSDNQFSSLVSLVYNIGTERFRTSTLLKKLNAGDYDGAADEFDRWIYSRGRIFNGLITRREREKELFLTPDE
jgi:lysozyme